jgi:hypothetical protein
MNRIELFNIVWLSPLSKIEQEKNIKIKDIKVACIKYEIPLPENGYWSKLKYHKHQPPPNLAPLVNKELSDSDNVFELVNKDISPLKRINIKKAEIENDKRIDLTVKQNKKSFDSDVQLLINDFNNRNNRWQRYEGTINSSRHLFPISVNESNLKRTFSILDSFFKALKIRGHKVEINDSHTLIISDEPIHLRLREKRVRYVKEKNSYGNYHGYKPTGMLYFIEGGSYGDVFLSDTQKVKIESKISYLIASLEILAEKKAVERLKREEIHRLNQLEREEQQRQKKLIAIEKQKVEELFVNSDNWVKSNNLRNYIYAFEQNAIQTNSLTEEVREYAKWAKLQADKLDPLKQ